ncbi:MAG: sulfite exporter TauE/SafE family protein [Candidatus Nanohaloarchaea archaeon]
MVLFVSIGALVKGLAGFGFGILGTALLANFIPAQDAVAVMIFPLLAVNIPLILEAETSELRSCVENYIYFILTGLAGSLIGILVIDLFPVQIISYIIGVAAVLYVYSRQDLVPRPENLVSKCFTAKWYNQSLIGGFSGISFGSTGLGLLFVTYLERLEVDKATFTGLLSLIILSATTIRASASYLTGLYTLQLIEISIIASIFGLIMVKIASRFRYLVPEKMLESFTLALILVAGLRILFG